MGPRLVSRGKKDFLTTAQLDRFKLQWGRDLLVAESRTPHPRRARFRSASMGPRLVSRGKYYGDGCTGPGKTRFNGAATC